MKVYEEYNSEKEKRLAQKGAQRGKITGKSRGYIMVFHEDGPASTNDPRMLNAFGPIPVLDPGSHPVGISHITAHHDYLNKKCRVVGFHSLPDEWQKALIGKLVDSIRDNYHDPINQRYHRLIRQMVRKFNMNLQIPEKPKCTISV